MVSSPAIHAFVDLLLSSTEVAGGFDGSQLRLLANFVSFGVPGLDPPGADRLAGEASLLPPLLLGLLPGELGDPVLAGSRFASEGGGRRGLPRAGSAME